MNILKLIFGVMVGALVAALLLWISLAVGCADPTRYLALVRAGLLILGLGGCAWGLLWQRMQIVFVSLFILGAGLLSFFYRAG